MGSGKVPIRRDCLGSRPESPCFHNGLDGRKGLLVSGRAFERYRDLEGGDAVSSDDEKIAAASPRSLQLWLIFSRFSTCLLRFLHRSGRARSDSCEWIDSY